MKPDAKQKFVSESIKPVLETADVQAMASGGPGMPTEFIWRDQPFKIDSVINTWRETGPCKNGSSESYARKHWYDVKTASNKCAKIYFERQSRGKDQQKRWWLFSIEP